jgi:NAD(P)-dependent dehydrogenase (short-subunit alcohol dehydrogenase family)
MPDLTGKTIFVTGASKGIGAAIAANLGEAGAHVIAHYGTDRKGAEEATSNIPADRCKLLAADLGSASEIKELWRDVLDWRGGIDVFVNNAAVMRVGGGIGADDEEWDAVWDEALRVNVLAYVIAPGVVRTRMSEEFAATLGGGEDAVTAGLAMGEWVPPTELADLVAFLSTGSCRHLSGATLDVNGATYFR